MADTGRYRTPPMTEQEAEGVVNVALHPALFNDFVAWLDARKCDLSPPIPDGDGAAFRVVSPRLLASVDVRSQS